MINRLSLLAAALVLGMLAAPRAALAVSTVEVETSGQSIGSAELTLYNEDTGETFRATEKKKCDDDDNDDDCTGVFIFGNLPDGQYSVMHGGQRVGTVYAGGGPTEVDVHIGPVGTATGFTFYAGANAGVKHFSFDNRGAASFGATGQGDTDSTEYYFSADAMVKLPSLPSPVPVWLAIEFGYVPSYDESTGSFDFHAPTPGLDTYLTTEVDWFTTVSLLLEVAQFQQAILMLGAGATIEKVEGSLTTDETGGGGNVERFTNDKLMISPHLRARVLYALSNLGNFGNNAGALFFVDLVVSFMDDFSGSGTSSLGFNYDFTVDGGTQVGASAGLLVPF